ncbi:MAG: RagB/SusD family nutrient uptake outer membrane protein [Cyclobacteriaceae bacterium]
MIKNTFILALSLIIFSGCEDFLDEENNANVTAETFYVTADGYESLINSNYAQLREIYGQSPWMFMSGTDLYSAGRGAGPDGLSMYTELNPSSSGANFIYNEAFQAIGAANLGLYYNDLTESVSTLSVRRGELLYMRANAYFLLVQSYGGVTLLTEPIQEAVTSFDRNSEAEIYTQIIADLEEAQNLVESGAFSGRVNQRAVQSLLGQVYLTRAYESFGSGSDFSTASSILDGVIGGQALNLSFEELWMPGNDMNEEVIFSVQFDGGSIGPADNPKGSQQQNFHGSYLGGSEVAGNAPFKSYSLCPHQFTLDLFEQGDERWEGTFMTEIYDRYYDYWDVADRSSLSVAHFYEPSWFTDADRDAYIAANPNTEYHAYETIYPEGADISNNFNTIVVKKFDDPTSSFASDGSNRRTSTRDFVVSRLGDVYLLAAEAHLGAGDNATALSRLNVVRARAGVADLTAIDIDVILDERARELIGEYKRWFDLKRTGKLIERASAHNPWIELSNFDGANGEQKILRPIPQEALDLNSNKGFTQNPAYN